MQTYQMFVKTINVVCDANKAGLERKLTLAGSLDKYDYNGLSFVVPQDEELSALGSGDEVRVTVEFVRSALEVELMRQADLEREEEDALA
jgi:hypothetical protein